MDHNLEKQKNRGHLWTSLFLLNPGMTTFFITTPEQILGKNGANFCTKNWPKTRLNVAHSLVDFALVPQSANSLEIRSVCEHFLRSFAQKNPAIHTHISL